MIHALVASSSRRFTQSQTTTDWRTRRRLSETSQHVEFSRTSLPRSLSPGEAVTVELAIPLAQVEPGQTVTVDLVREWIFWFAEAGSDPLVLSVPGR